MKKTKKKKRDIFGEIMSGIDSMKQHREGKITLKNYKLAAIELPEIDPDFIRKTREKLNMSQGLTTFPVCFKVRFTVPITLITYL